MRYSLITSFIVLFLIKGLILSGQNINLNIQSGYVELPSFSEEEVSIRNYYFAQILNPNGISGKNFSLKMVIKSSKLTISSIVDRSNYISLNGEAVKIVDIYKIARLFRLDDLVFQGVTKEQYLVNGLPDGLYDVCFEMVDVTFDAANTISQSCLLQQVKTHNPPAFTLPNDNAILTLGEIHAFQWRPRHITAYPVSYEYMVFEYEDNWSYGQALAFDKPVISYVTPSLSHVVQTQDLADYANTKLVAIVRVFSDNPNLKFKNNGFSEPLIFTLSDTRNSEDNDMNCSIPDAEVFINEISQGCKSTGYGSKEYIELVVAKGKAGIWNLSQRIIDDNNYLLPEVGNEPGHIKLGSCFHNIPVGTIILIYNDLDLHPLIDPNKDGTPNADGVYQLPFSDPCIEKYDNCPNQTSNDNYNCGQSNNSSEWNHYIPMRNDKDVLQIRSYDESFTHGLRWGNAPNESETDERMVTITPGSAENLTFIFEKGTNWNALDNWTTVAACTGSGGITNQGQESPGMPNSIANELLIKAIKDGTLTNEFEIECVTLISPNMGGEVNMLNGSGVYEITIGDMAPVVTNDNPYVVNNLPLGTYSVCVRDTIFDCTAYCTLELTCNNVGQECNDYNDCTVNDTLNYQCLCVGEQIIEVVIEEDILIDTLCSYCIPIGPAFYGLSTDDYIITHSIILRLPSGELDTLDSDDNFEGFNFPYCYGGAPSNCIGYSVTISEFPSHFNNWIVNNNYQGHFKGDKFCSIGLFMSLSNLDVIEMTGTGPEGDNISLLPINQACEYDTTYQLFVESGCDSVGQYSWSTGEETSSIEIDTLGGCYEVTITCLTDTTDYCELIGQYGENCDTCVVGQICDDNNPCTANDQIDINCECTGIQYPDSDGDGVCDELDICFGFDDNEDSDDDGVPDGCDLCHGQPDSVLPEYVVELLLDNNPDNDPNLSPWGCEEYPCNDTLEIVATEMGSELCDYCLDLTSLVDQQDDLKHISSVTYLENGVEKTFTYNSESIISDEDFENGWGIWSGKKDCNRRDTILSNSPDHCIELRDNTGYSNMVTNKLNICNAYKVRIDFSFLTQGFDYFNHDFWIQYRNSGESYTTVKIYNFGQDFTNNVRYFESVEIEGPFSTSTQFRIRCDADNDFDVLYIDDVKITAQKSKTYSCKDFSDDDFVESWLYQFVQEIDYFGYAENVTYTDGDSELCGGNGNFVSVLNSNIELISASYYTSTGIGLLSFYSPDCGDLGPGDKYTNYTVNIDCEDPDILWSNGMTTDSILVPSVGGYAVTVTCPDGCEYIDTIPGKCFVGSSPCQPSLCFENDGYYDENCNCVGATPIENADPDGDGLCGEDDPCPCDGENVDSDGDDICDCMECPELPNIQKKIRSNEIYEDYCDYTFPIYLATNQDLIDVTINDISIKDEEPFNFEYGYCYDLVELECETTPDIFDSNYKIIPSLRRFISQFRFYLSNEGYSNFIFKDTLINNQDHLILKNIPLSGIVFNFQNIDIAATGSNCYEVQTEQELYVKDVMLGPDGYECISEKYLWSNGDTTPTIHIPYPSTAGYCLTVTCADGCEVVTCLEGSCIFGETCNDYDSCTVNDVFDAFCNCVGEATPDSDGDGVSDFCDLCPGFDDNLDIDNDSIPDGCDTCGWDDTAELCDYCTGFPYIANSKYLTIGGFDITHNGVQVSNGLNSLVNGLCISFGSVDNCPNGNEADQLVDNINQWMSSNGYNGQASIIMPFVGSHVCCPDFVDTNTGTDKGKGSGTRAPVCIVLQIVSTDLNFNSISASYGNQTATSNFTQHNCVGGGGPKPCNDMDDCTFDDHYDENCNCVGTFVDSDDDTVCDIYDQCPGHPDYMDADGDGIPDGCDEIEIPCDTSTYLSFCDYVENRIGCATNPDGLILQYDLRQIQEELRAFFQELNWESEHFNVPALMESLQSELDSDGDGVFDYFDPCPCYFNQSLFDTGKLTEAERLGCCGQSFTNDCGGSVSNIITDGTQAQLMVQWMFAVQQDIDEDGNPPACAEYLGIDMIETDDGWTYNSDTCTVRFTVNCDCECGSEIVDDFDGDGICNAIDTIYGEECNITCETTVCQYAIIENCECTYFELPDSDGDGVCDLIDECQPGPGITFDPGSTPQEFDDLLDSDNDGTPDCKDACPTGGWMGLEDPELPTPTGPGDPCDDGDPCTFADAISDNCNCEGILLDFDNDGTTDCGDCIIYYDDTSTVAVDYVEVNPNINFIDCDNCYFVGLDMNDDGVPDVPCDVCPQLSDSLDYNTNGVPDCIDPPYMEIGCPETSALIFEPEAGIMLSFDSEEIELDDLPNPIGAIISAETGAGGDDIHTYDYVTLTFTREVDGKFEAFYSIPDLGYTGTLEYAGVSYANHQNCVIYSNEENVGVTCPTGMTVNSLTQQLELHIEVPGGTNADLLNFFGTYIVSLTGGGSPINMTTDVSGADIISIGGDAYTVLLDVAPSGTGDFSGYSGSITLPNGVACPYTNGGVDGCPDPAIVIGNPCDDNDPCTHHDRYDENCECTGDASPDTDNDGLCDEIDPCRDVPNTAPDNDGDGYPDCPCPPVVFDSDVIISGGDVLFPINESSTSGIDEFNFSITGGPDGVILDTTDTEMPVTVSNLPKGYVYEITITSQGSNGCESDTTISVAVPFDNDPALCGLDIQLVDLQTLSLLPSLSNGDVFRASDFDITVREAKGSYGKFTGKGYIKIPVLGNPRINVTFNNVTISDEFQLIDGVVIVNGFGLAILGDPLSDEINDIVNDILNVLDDINDILDELIPLLETIDELVATTGDLVSEATKNCVTTAQAELEALKVQAELNPDDPTLIQAIKDKAAELKVCIEAYEQELALLLDKYLSFLTDASNIIVTDCQSNNDYENPLQQIFNTNDPEANYNLDLNQILPNLGGTGPAGNNTIEFETDFKTDFGATPTTRELEAELFYDAESQRDLCLLIGELKTKIENADASGKLAIITAVLKATIEVAKDLAEVIKDDIQNNVDNAIIYQNHKTDVDNAFKALIVYKMYNISLD